MDQWYILMKNRHGDTETVAGPFAFEGDAKAMQPVGITFADGTPVQYWVAQR